MAQGLHGAGIQASPRLRAGLAALFLGLICALAVQIPHLVLHRAFDNLDLQVHYHYAREFTASAMAGDPWPRFAFNAQNGLGEPGLLYYAPLYYWLTWLVHGLTGNVWIAMQVVEVLAGTALGFFCWLLAADHADPRRALIAVPLAVLAPMAVMLQLDFNGYPWACALAPLAMLTWAVLRPAAQGLWFNPWAVVALTLTVLTHTVTGEMAVLMLAALSLTALATRRTQALTAPELWSPALTALLGLLLSAAYLLPAFGMQGLIDSGVWRRNYTPFNAFSLSTITALVNGIRWFAFQWPVSALAMALCGFGWLALRRAQAAQPQKRLAMGVLGILALVVFLSTELSYPLWLIDSPLRNIQFPHRLITLLVPSGSVLVAVALATARARPMRLALGAIAFASVALGLAVIAKDSLRDGAPIDVAERTFAPYPGLDEYRTKAASRTGPQLAGYDLARACAAQGMACTVPERQGRGLALTVKARQGAALALPVYCFPAWQLSIDGMAVPSACEGKTALVQVAIPPGNHRIAVQWQAVPLERLGLAVTLATLCFLICAVLIGARRRNGWSGA